VMLQRQQQGHIQGLGSGEVVAVKGFHCVEDSSHQPSPQSFSTHSNRPGKREAKFESRSREVSVSRSGFLSIVALRVRPVRLRLIPLLDVHIPPLSWTTLAMPTMQNRFGRTPPTRTRTPSARKRREYISARDARVKHFSGAFAFSPASINSPLLTCWRVQSRWRTGTRPLRNVLLDPVS
jgi:hypothetical protein